MLFKNYTGLSILIQGVSLRFTEENLAIYWKVNFFSPTFPIQRQKWQPTPEFSPGEFLWQKSPVGHSPQGLKESDTADAT